MAGGSTARVKQGENPQLRALGKKARDLLDVRLETHTFLRDFEKSYGPHKSVLHDRHKLGSRPAKDWLMLVLSRKKDESIVINNDITIVVIEIRGDKVRLGIEAPKEVPVHRREVFEAIARGEPVDNPAVSTASDTSASRSEESTLAEGE